jgi:hypothetical protein
MLLLDAFALVNFVKVLLYLLIAVTSKKGISHVDPQTLYEHLTQMVILVTCNLHLCYCLFPRH